MLWGPASAGPFPLGLLGGLDVVDGEDDFALPAAALHHVGVVDVDSRLGQPAAVAPELAWPIVERRGQDLSRSLDLDLVRSEDLARIVSVVHYEMNDGRAVVCGS